MKEKTIEKIPYLGLKKISRIKSVKYIGVTAVKNIGHQRHLFLEVYENKKESKKIPVVRMALTKKDLAHTGRTSRYGRASSFQLTALYGLKHIHTPWEPWQTRISCRARKTLQE